MFTGAPLLYFDPTNIEFLSSNFRVIRAASVPSSLSLDASKNSCRRRGLEGVGNPPAL